MPLRLHAALPGKEIGSLLIIIFYPGEEKALDLWYKENWRIDLDPEINLEKRGPAVMLRTSSKAMVHFLNPRCAETIFKRYNEKENPSEYLQTMRRILQERFPNPLVPWILYLSQLANQYELKLPEKSLLEIPKTKT